MKPLISIIIPVFNHAFILEKVLNTIYAQDYRPLEVIIVNDGSTDNFKTVEDKIINSCEAQDCNEELSLRIIHQENKGAAHARNTGFKESKGKFIIFWDADVLAKPTMLTEMYAALEQNPKASYAYSQLKLGWKKIKSRPFDAAALKKFNYIDMISLIRREHFPGFDESLKRFQDWDLWLTMLNKGSCGIFIPKILKKVFSSKRKGISTWTPSFFYRLPWKTKTVKSYLQSRKFIEEKHRLELE